MEAVDPGAFNKIPMSLHVPFLVNVSKMDPVVLDGLLDLITSTLGAEYFRDKAIFMEVMSDAIQKAKDPYKFLDGPYIQVMVKNDGVLRLTTAEKAEGGSSVYGLDQICALLDAIEYPQVQDLSFKSADRPKG